MSSGMKPLEMPTEPPTTVAFACIINPEILNSISRLRALSLSLTRSASTGIQWECAHMRMIDVCDALDIDTERHL